MPYDLRQPMLQPVPTKDRASRLRHRFCLRRLSPDDRLLERTSSGISPLFPTLFVPVSSGATGVLQAICPPSHAIGDDDNNPIVLSDHSFDDDKKTDAATKSIVDLKKHFETTAHTIAARSHRASTNKRGKKGSCHCGKHLHEKWSG